MTTESAEPAPPQATTRALIGRLLKGYLRKHYGTLGIAAFAMAIAAAATAGNAWMMEPVLDEVFLNGNRQMLILVPIAILFIAVLKGVAGFVQGYLMSVVGQKIIAEIQNELFAHLMRADLAFFNTTATGGLISNFLNDVNLLRETLSKAITGIVKDSLGVIFLVGLLFYQDWRLAIATVFVLPLAIVPIRKLGKRMRKASTQNQERTEEFSTLLNESFVGARHVKAYGMEDYETARAEKANTARLVALFKVIRTRAAATPLMEMLGGVAIAVVVYYGGTRVLSGETTPGTFFSFITALLLAYQPLKSLANLNAALQEGMAAAQRVFSMFDNEPLIKDPPDATDLKIAGGAIQFDQVRYSYDEVAPALNGISFEVLAGQTVALVGPSGAGKSTVLNLIPRFYDTTTGTVSVDGQNIRTLTQKSLRAEIALVSQDATLFNDTIRANIAYGKPNASDAEIVAAAKSAAAHDFIVETPGGYEAMAGESGVKLSGGQRQRIAIARAILKDAPILLLDEATSALDSASERQVQTALSQLSQGRTTLIVAHRLSTVIDADCIHVLDGGRIMESGTHAELLARGGLYAKLYALQAVPDKGPSRAQA